MITDHESNAQAAALAAKRWAYDGFAARTARRRAVKGARAAFIRGNHPEMQLFARIAESNRQIAKLANTRARANIDFAIRQGREWVSESKAQ